MARGEQVLRQWKLLRMLQTRGEGVLLRQLADSLGVAERTVQRDLEVLEELGFPVEYDQGDYGKRLWRLPHGFLSSGPLVLSLTEAISLHLAEKLFTSLAGTYFDEGLRSVVSKIRSIIPPNALEYFSQLDDVLYVRRTGQTDYAPFSQVIRLLLDAARAAQTVEIDYRPLWRQGEGYTTLFDPYGLVYYDGDLFLLGKSHRAAGLRLFKVARVQGARPTSKGFKRPKGLNLEEQFRGSFGITQSSGEPVEIKVRFTGPVAALVQERRWHESQKLAWLPAEASLFDDDSSESGDLVATFSLNNLIEFKQWIKGLGADAEILSPAWLREEMHRELAEAARRYEL